MKITRQQVLEEFPNLRAPSFSSVKSVFYRARAKELPPPLKTPGTIKIRAHWALTNNGNRFFLQKCNDFGVYLFAIDKMIETLATCKIVLCDGNFKSAPQPFLQHFTMFGAKAGRKILLVFAFMAGKSAARYRKVFQILKQKIQKVTGEPNWSPDFLISDFEGGIKLL